MGRKKKRSSAGTKTISNFIAILSCSYIGKILVYIVIGLIVLGITAFASGNDFDRFFKAMGVEVLIVTIAGWILYLAMKKEG